MKQSLGQQIGARIRQIRGKLTQSQFAQLLSVKQNYVSRYETGRIPPPLLLQKIARHGNVSMDWLFTGKAPGGGEPLPTVRETARSYGGSAIDREIAHLLRQLKLEDKRTVVKLLRGMIAFYSP